MKIKDKSWSDTFDFLDYQKIKIIKEHKIKNKKYCDYLFRAI